MTVDGVEQCRGRSFERVTMSVRHWRSCECGERLAFDWDAHVDGEDSNKLLRQLGCASDGAGRCWGFRLATMKMMSNGGGQPRR